MLPKLRRSNHIAEEFVEVVSGQAWDVKRVKFWGKELEKSPSSIFDLVLKDTKARLRNSPFENLIINLAELSKERGHYDIIKANLFNNLTESEKMRILLVDIDIG